MTDQSGMLQLVGFIVVLMLQRLSSADSSSSLATCMVKQTEDPLGIHVASFAESTEAYTLEDHPDQGRRGTDLTSSPTEQPEEGLTIVTVVSSDFDNESDNDDGNSEVISEVISWSWYPIKWTWVNVAELLVGIIGILGNLLVITVLFQRRAKSRSTDTLIGALGVADLMTSVGLLPIPSPKTVPSTWQAQIYCRVIWQPLYMWGWAVMSGFVLTAISVERYIAVTHPIYFNRILTRRRVSEVVVFLWICAVISCLPGLFVIEVNEEFHQCAVPKLPPSARTAFAFYVTFVQLILPATIMVVTQTFIALKLHRQSKRFEGSNSYHLSASKAVIRLMLIVIVVYLICWTPNRFFLLITNALRIHDKFSEVFVVLAAVNSSINPIIYSARYAEFRQAVKTLFLGGKVRNKAMFGDEFDVDTRSTTDDTHGMPNGPTHEISKA